MDLQNKNIVIIGGTSGIGLAAAEGFVASGAGLVVVGLDEESCEVAQDILGNQAVVLQGDAVDEKTAAYAIEQCNQHFGQLTGLYHVAGSSGRKYGDGPLHEMSIEGWNKTFEVNLTSLMLSNRAALRAFLASDTVGSILNLTSVLASSPAPHYFTTHGYAAAKSAVIGLTKSTAAHYAKYGIRINGLAPGLVDSPMAQRAAQNRDIMAYIKTKQPLDGGRIGSPTDLVGAALYFMSDYSQFTTGQILSVDGGWSTQEGQIISNE
ncbi:SDR family NAD(P)-dependent oxidoreductase [Membranihabitans marinus]|uniref:SDR family NAD(P)-dependent oxidoreductase n=1 Tax=Membranihabitans marinus TaxID=1227546 RepID=UPI001F485B04|nr:SDR family oxidoreductase [Membranihabitans marinus]